MRIINIVKDGIERAKKELMKERSLSSGLSPEDEKRVLRIIEDVKEGGDDALIRYTEKFDGEVLTTDRIAVDENELNELAAGFSENFYRAIKVASDRVEAFHTRAVPHDWSYIDEYGDLMGQKYTPVESVGIYVPGGKASYPSTVVMTAVIARVAGVKRIAVISPPSSFVRPSAVAAAIKTVGGVTDVYRIGGVQGIAALAFGTKSVRKVDKIVGPGNVYVTMAKKLLYGYIDIDMIAGPSEVLVIADGSVDVESTAADLIAQAEHDEAAKPLCITFDEKVAEGIVKGIDRLLSENPRRDIAKKSIENNGFIFIVESPEQAVELADTIAPEHLEIHTENPRYFANRIRNAGAIFIGGDSAEAFGDYISGPSHVLPTGGTARFFSPLNVLSFMKISSIVEMSKLGSRILGANASIIAELEGLYGHKKSIELRGER